MFNEVRTSVYRNIELANRAGASISLSGVDPVRAFVASQTQMLVTMDEIERQANVGIGYAYSAEHLMAEQCMQAH
jgi:hypothetical protein